MERRDGLDPSDLDRPDWNSLLNNYQLHDIGEAYFQGHVEELGLNVEHWGIDQRHDDGDGLIFDNKLDLRIWDADDSGYQSQWTLEGLADVKTKSNPDWFGVFNLRHLAHYAEWADHHGVPVFVYMTMVDPDEQAVGDDEFIVPVPSNWDWRGAADHYDPDSYTSYSYGEMKDIARTCPIVGRTFRAPDGNLVVKVDEDERRGWDWFMEHVIAQ
jgi:hypothetical protein